MSQLVCPKCRAAVADAALDAGACPACGFPLDGPVVLGSPGAKSAPAWLSLAAGGAAFAAGLAVGYALFAGSAPPPPGPAPVEVAAVVPAPAQPPAAPVASPSVPPKQPDKQAQANSEQGVQPPPKPEPPQPETPKVDPPKPEPPKPQPPKPEPPKPEPPKVDPPKPPAALVRIDPREEPEKKVDLPDGTVAVPDLNGDDRVTLTGKVKTLRIGSVHGKGILDASGLEAAEVVITGDLDGDGTVMLNAPNGKVTIGGHVVGNARLAVAAPGGEVVVLAGSGLLDGGSQVAITAKRLDVKGLMAGGTRMKVMVSAGGSLKFAALDGGATVTYRRAAPTDPEPAVERGEIRGGASVTPEG